MGKDRQESGTAMKMMEWALCIVSMAIVTAIGDAEAVRGILQLIGHQPSRHTVYAVTGSFYNPGPYGCLLGLSFVTAFALAGTHGPDTNARVEKALRLYGFGSMLVIMAPLAASMSRTGWIAALVGCSLNRLLRRYAVRNGNKDAGTNRSPARTRLIWVLISLTAVVVSGGLYAVKTRSALGRFLIWKCGMKAALQAPLRGVGEKYAIGAYGEAQEQYFRSGTGSEAEIMAAGSPEYFFNEYLHIAVAYGIPASAGFVALLVFAFTNAAKAKAYGAAAGVVALAIVCMASYPFESRLWVATACCLVTGVLAAPGLQGRCSMTIRWLAVVSAILTAWHVCSALKSRDLNETRRLFEYGRSLQKEGRYGESQKVLALAMKQCSDYMIPALMSKNADAMGDTATARQLLEKAVWRCPARMYPRYLLMLHYGNCGDTVRMRLQARGILDMPVKVHSTATSEMRQAAHLLLN